MSRKIIGLDVRYDAISIVLIDSSLREKQVQGFMHIPVPENENRDTALASALETILGQMDTSGSLYVSSFPAEDIYYRNIRIPFKGDKKISQVLPFELEPMLPVPVDNLIIDFHPVNSSINGDYTDIIAAAVKKTSLETYLNILAAAGADPKTVSIGAYPTARYMSSLKDMPGNWILLDLNDFHASAFLIDSGQINLIRSFPLQDSARNESPGNASPGNASIATNLKQTIIAFEENLEKDYVPEKIYITGYALKYFTPEQENSLETFMEVPVVRADLLALSDITIKPAQRISWKPDEMNTALALALAETEGTNKLNFRKGPFALRKNWETHKSNLIKTGIFSLILLTLIFTNIIIDSWSAGKKLDRLDSQIMEIFKSTLPEVTRIVDPLHQMQVAMNEIKKNTFIPGAAGNSVRIVDILNELSRQIPKEIDVEFTRMVAGQDDLLISGSTDTFNSVDIIQTKIDKSDLFKKVTINSSKKDKTTNRIQFKMKVDL